MSLKLDVLLERTTYAPGEAIAPLAVVANTGSTPTRVPNWRAAAGYFPRFKLTGPSGAGEFSFSERATPNAREEAELGPGLDRGRTVALGERSNRPGTYELSFYFELGDARLQSSSIGWEREPRGTQQAVVPRGQGTELLLGQPCFHLFHGERTHALYETRLTSNEEEFPPFACGPAVRLADVDPGAHGLVGSVSTADNPKLTDHWVAWLSGQRVHAGKLFLGFNHTSLELPFAPGRIVGVLLRADGGADVFVLSEDHQQLALVVFAEPTERVEEVGEEDGEPLPEPTGIEPFDPMELVEMLAPSVAWTLGVEEPLTHVALARSADAASRTGLASVAEREDGALEVRFASFDAASPPQRWGQQRVAAARTLPDAAPALCFDAAGNAQIALLGRTAPSRQEPKHDRFALIRASFDAEGEPLLTPGTRYQDLGPLKSEPESCALAFFQPAGEEPFLDWALLQEDGALLGGRGETATRLSPFPAGELSRPLQLVSLPTGFYMPVVDEQGVVTIAAV